MMMDVVYFGYEYEKDSAKLQDEFISEVKEKFANVELKDAFDDIKGYRQEVHLPDEHKKNYQSWLIGNGWFEMSLTMQIIMRDRESTADFKEIFELAKKQYPKAFKPEALKNQ